MSDVVAGNSEGVNARFGYWLALALAVLALDQVTKAYVSAALYFGERIDVLPVLSWILLHNEGAAFSFLNDAGGWQRWFLAALAVGFSIFLIFELRRLRSNEYVLALAYALILGGALGNLVDRVRLGHVVDFVLVHWESHYFPAFNVADAGITVGAAIWIALQILPLRSARIR